MPLYLNNFFVFVLSLLSASMINAEIAIEVPFKTQVPPGIWTETKNCGQASSLMVFCYYLKTIPTEQGIRDIDDWFYENYGDPINNYNGWFTKRHKLEALSRDYALFWNSYTDNGWSLDDIKHKIAEGLPVIVAVAGVLDGQYWENNEWHIIAKDYSATGHWLVAKGYSDTHVICNDPGTIYGHNIHYSIDSFSMAMYGWSDIDWNGAVIIVQSTIYIPDDYLTIQDAITNSVDGTTIIVRDGTYTGPGNRDIDFMGKAITLRSENGPKNCIINCQATEADCHRGFDFHNREGPNSILDGFTITNGNEAFGGAIRCTDYSNPTIKNCHLVNNVAADGGGIYCSYYSNPVVKDCLIENNIAGGLWSSGGGIWANTSPRIENCIIRNNIAGDQGGGLAFSGSVQNPSISKCQIVGNSANFGGGIYSSARNLTAVNCQINGNRANSRGGGFYTYTSSSNMGLLNCTISGNWAVSEQFDNDGGGGIYCAGSGAKLTNSILWDNIAVRGTEAFLLSSDAEMTFSYCNVYNNLDSIYVKNANVLWEMGNLNIDPLFVSPGYWDPNSTPEEVADDYWVEGDYHLKSQAGRWSPSSASWLMDDITSRCIDAGNPGYSLNDEPVSPDNKRINLGYYGGTTEATKTPPDWSMTSDITNDGLVYHGDLLHQVTGWLFMEDNQNGDLNRDGVINLIDFLYLASEWMGQTSWYGN